MGTQTGAIEANGLYAAGQADTVLVAAPGVGKQIWVIALTLHTKVTGQIQLRDATNIVGSHRYDLAANQIESCDMAALATPWGINKAVTVTSDIAGNHFVRAYYFIR